MDERILTAIVPAIGLVSGLIATYVSLQNRALLAEVRKELAELENRIILRLNGLYMRRSECELHNALLENAIESDCRRQGGGKDQGRISPAGSYRPCAAGPDAVQVRAESGVPVLLEQAQAAGEIRARQLFGLERRRGQRHRLVAAVLGLGDDEEPIDGVSHDGHVSAPRTIR
ncbi:MAG: hypothetical protein KatS3mg082_2675 [Nitrospiraceae bacterium]|nr:MAG: hypothetical protein KatS3mg082_2675 [Nitrospiraceae bacterium]